MRFAREVADRLLSSLLFGSLFGVGLILGIVALIRHGWRPAVAVALCYAVVLATTLVVSSLLWARER